MTALHFLGYIALPPHVRTGGFDHAAVHNAASLLYVAHTANDALDVVDCQRDVYVRSIPDLTGVAGALVSEEHQLVFTSNRGENTVGILSPGRESVVKVPVGVRPNGLAFDPGRKLLLAANVGDPAIPDSFTVSIVDLNQRMMTANIPVPGRTRWAVFDADADVFYVNISDPAQVLVVDARNPAHVARSFEIPVPGPHGLDLDAAQRRLFCACDGGHLVVVDTDSGKVTRQIEIGGMPDVVFFNPALKHLYVAIGDPGFIEVFDTEAMKQIETVATERGAHTLAFDAARNRVYSFLPQTHRAAVFQYGG